MATPSMRSLEKAMELLTHVAADGGERSISALAAEIGLPLSTAYRIAATFTRGGFMTRLKRGHYLAGPTLLRLVKADSLKQVLVEVGRPVIKRLASQTRCTSHLGIFEGGMVTYLLKAGRARGRVFTREGTQLVAYCTGIGKVLLAALPEAQLEQYLADGPFIPLTPNTLTDPDSLRDALSAVQAQGYATDDAEMDTDLVCLAVPVRDSEEKIIAAMSIATRQTNRSARNLLTHLGSLRSAATTLAQQLAPRWHGPTPSRRAR